MRIYFSDGVAKLTFRSADGKFLIIPVENIVDISPQHIYYGTNRQECFYITYFVPNDFLRVASVISPVKDLVEVFRAVGIFDKYKNLFYAVDVE